MAVKLDIFVSDVFGKISSGYEKISVYRSTREASDYSETTTSGTRIDLDVNVSRYQYFDVFGNADNWYKWSYVSGDGLSESSLSPATRGTISGSSYRGASFPSEVYLSSAQQDTVYRVRQLIGDFKEINRDYISPDTSYDAVSQDGFTVEIDNTPAWPLSISVDGQEFTNINDPVVQGYKFVTFSGTEITSVSGTVADIWYESFRFSDKRILDSYMNVDPPRGLTQEQTTVELFEIQAAITLLEAELREFMATSSSEVDIYQEIRIDPSSGLRARQEDLKSLRKKRDDLVDAVISNNLTLFGIRIE